MNPLIDFEREYVLFSAFSPDAVVAEPMEALVAFDEEMALWLKDHAVGRASIFMRSLAKKNFPYSLPYAKPDDPLTDHIHYMMIGFYDTNTEQDFIEFVEDRTRSG